MRKTNFYMLLAFLVLISLIFISLYPLSVYKGVCIAEEYFDEDNSGEEWCLSGGVMRIPYPQFTPNHNLGKLLVDIVDYGHYGNRIYVRFVKPSGTVTGWVGNSKTWDYNEWPETKDILVTTNLNLDQTGKWVMEMYQEEKGGSLGGTPGWTENYRHENLFFYVGNFSLNLTIRDSVSNAWLSGAVVSLSQRYFSDTKTTNTMGATTFSVRQGTYQIGISKDGYDSLSIPYTMGVVDDSQVLMLTPSIPDIIPGKMQVFANCSNNSVEAEISIVGTDIASGITTLDLNAPLQFDLSPGSYAVIGVFNGSTQTVIANVVSGETTNTTLVFTESVELPEESVDNTFYIILVAVIVVFAFIIAILLLRR